MYKFKLFKKACHRLALILVQKELPRPIKIRPWMYVRCSIMYEKAAFCSPEEYSSVARLSVPLKFDFLFSPRFLFMNKA